MGAVIAPAFITLPPGMKTNRLLEHLELLIIRIALYP